MEKEEEHGSYLPARVCARSLSLSRNDLSLSLSLSKRPLSLSLETTSLSLSRNDLSLSLSLSLSKRPLSLSLNDFSRMRLCSVSVYIKYLSHLPRYHLCPIKNNSKIFTFGTTSSSFIVITIVIIDSCVIAELQAIRWV